MKVWNEVGSKFTVRNRAIHHDKLPVGIYVLEWDNVNDEFYLEFSQSDYKHAGKLYDLDTDFIARVMKTYTATNSNLGILLVGIKGTGKSVTAKQLSNNFCSLGVPVIVIPKSYDGIGSFINMIHQDVAIFVDEYEKIFDESRGRDSHLLSLMDGAFDNGHRRSFILTSNTMRVNDNIIQRPGRIRYLKKYADTPLSTIITIVDDRLKHRDLRDETIKFMSEMEIITIDIITAIIDEVNIHTEPPQKFASVFNIKVRDISADVYEFNDNGRTLYASGVDGLDMKYSNGNVGERFSINRSTLGYICKVIAPDTIMVNTNGKYDEKNIATARTFNITPGRICHPSFKTFYC